MGLSQKLVLKQGQALKMTQKVQQAIALLPMSAIEVDEYVAAEAQINVFLKKDESYSASHSGAEPPSGPVDSLSAREDRGGRNGAANETQGPAGSAAAQSLYPGTAWPSSRRSGGAAQAGEDWDSTANVASTTTLSEHLAGQLQLEIKDSAERLIGEHLIGMVNDEGRLDPDYLGIADTLGVAPELVEKVLAVLRTFDPIGVFARDLAECWKLQLEDRGTFSAPMAALIAHLDLLGRSDYQALRRICGVGQEELLAMKEELRTLDAKPGLAFGSEPLSPVIPDIFVRPAPDGSWVVELNSETLPRVLLDKTYIARVSSRKSREDEKQFLASQLDRANWLIRSLDQRANTILKTAQEIVRQQDAFLVKGVQHMKPLTLRIVADAIGRSESTVSRVTTSKYMATPRGNFELKYFFTNAIPSSESDGMAHSSESVRHRIKALVATETPDRILSDDDIVSALLIEGIDLARRTVAKYRESLGIPSSVKRRREARLKG